VNPEAPPPSTAVALSVAGITNRYAATIIGTKTDLRWSEKKLEFTATATNAVVVFQSLNKGCSGPISDAVTGLPISSPSE